MAFTPMHVERREQIFPTLTESQLQRISRFGTRRSVKDGEILFTQGDDKAHFFVILRGALDVVQPQGDVETLIVRHEPGNFTGETAMLAGRRALATGRFRGDGEVVDIPPEGLRNLIVADAELSELLMRDYAASTAVADFQKTAEEQHVEVATKTFAAMTLNGVRPVDRYKDEKKGIYYVVVKMELEDVKDMLLHSTELNSQMRDFVRKNADRAFERLEKEEHKREILREQNPQ